MKHLALTLLISAVSVSGTSSMPAAQEMIHKVVPTDGVQWSPAPPSVPPGAQAAVLLGDPSKEGLFVLRLKMPSGYHIAPHKHPTIEVVTVVSGTFKLGSGETADRSHAQPLPAGSFFAFSPGMVHYAYTDEETVVQISTNGPWGITYVNPKDDPRQRSQ